VARQRAVGEPEPRHRPRLETMRRNLLYNRPLNKYLILLDLWFLLIF
jgi:hypothetical protein